MPRFSDIMRSLMNLTRHDTEFIWTEKCDKAFKHLKELLMQHPILRYPDLGHLYTLFTDTSGIGWAGVLMQEFEDDKRKKKQHPICYMSGQFRGSQQNWAALTKEAYAIYMAIRKLSFYITDAEVTIKCDHSSIEYRHSRLSSFGTSNFFQKNMCTRMGIFLFVIFAAPVPTCRSCCFIHVTYPSLYWVLVLAFYRSI